MNDKKYAIVGASNNKEKYGYKVLKNLMKKGFNVVPINPYEEKILKLKVFKMLSEIENVDTVIFIVPPPITEKILKDVKSLNIKNVWMQPGSESNKAIQFCKENNINYVANVCIMNN